MKKHILFLLICLGLTQWSLAQIDRSTYPKAGPAPEIQLSDPVTFTLENGLKVFVVENRKLPRVAFSLVLERDPILEGDKAGMTGFVGEMLTAGTSNRTKEELDEEVDFIGASLNASSTSLFGSSLKQHQEKILELMTDVLYNPVFPESELDKLKKQAISGLAASKDDPDAISGILGAALTYGKDHPYGENQTEETTNNVTLEDIQNYYQTYFKPNAAYLAIVGDITSDEAERLVKEYFGEWQKGEVPGKSYDTPSRPEKNKVALVDRSSAVQSVLRITYPLEMSLNNADYLSTRVLNYILGGGASSRLFTNLREDKGYTYGAYSSIGSDKLVTSFSANASVRTEVTDSAVHEMIYEIRNIVESGVTEKELEAAKANLSGSFGRSLESPSTIANFAINKERYNLPDDFYTTYLQRLNDLTIEEINEVAKKYIHPENMYITVVGNGSEIKEKLERFGEVKLYTNRGDEAKEIVMEDTDITAEEILENYITAIGGEEAAKSIKTAKIEMKAELQGMELTTKSAYDVPNQMLSNKVIMMGNVASNIVLKDGKATVNAMGQSQTLTDEQYEELKMSMFIFPELHYEEMGYSMSLDGIKDVEGKNAYKLIITNPTGGKVINYYSLETGLKIKNENEISGDTMYNVYDEFDGVKYPVDITLMSPQIPMPLNSTLVDLKFNTSFDEDDFE